jgi:hypothetical protein
MKLLYYEEVWEKVTNVIIPAYNTQTTVKARWEKKLHLQLPVMTLK